MVQWLSMQNAPQNVRRRSSNSAQSFGGSRVGAISSGGQSSRCNPSIWTSLTAFAELIAALVNHMDFASSVVMRHQAWACWTVMKCSP